MLITIVQSLCFLMIFSILFAFAESGGDILDRKNGFRDLKFGTNINKIEGLLRTDQEHPWQSVSQNVSCFKRKNDRLEIFNKPLNSIIYCFYKDSFFNVIITTEGPSSKSILYDFCKALNSGTDYKIGDGLSIGSCLVEGKNTKFIANVRIYENKDRDNGTFDLMSKKFESQIEKEKLSDF